MTRVSGSGGKSALAAARARRDDWDFELLCDDDEEVGPAWVKRYFGGIKHRVYGGEASLFPNVLHDVRLSGNQPTVP